jgi:hypothetical protein
MDDLLKIVDALADAADPFSMTKEIGSFSRISIESRKLVEINDIQDELNTIKSILSTQEFVLEEFQKLIQPRDKTAESDTTTGTQASQPVLERRTTGSSGRNGSTALKSCRAVTESIQTVKNDLLKVGEMSDSAGRVKDEVGTSARPR